MTERRQTLVFNLAEDVGKFDDEAIRIASENDASAVVLLVIGAKKGTGLSFAGTDATYIEKIPALLRAAADAMTQGRELPQ